jgi:hypothetical protein
MSQSTELHVPDGYYPPFAVVTDTDHGAYIIIAVSLIRIFLRITFLQRAGLDDTFLAAGTVSGHMVNHLNISNLTSRFLHSYSHVLF